MTFFWCIKYTYIFEYHVDRFTLLPTRKEFEKNFLLVFKLNLFLTVEISIYKKI